MSVVGYMYNIAPGCFYGSDGAPAILTAGTLVFPCVLSLTLKINILRNRNLFFINSEEGKLYCFATSFSYYLFVGLLGLVDSGGLQNAKSEETSFPPLFFPSLSPKESLLCFSRNQFYYFGFGPFLSKAKYSASFSSEVYIQMWCQKGETWICIKYRTYVMTTYFYVSHVCHSDFHTVWLFK